MADSAGDDPVEEQASSATETTQDTAADTEQTSGDQVTGGASEHKDDEGSAPEVITFVGDATIVDQGPGDDPAPMAEIDGTPSNTIVVNWSEATDGGSDDAGEDDGAGAEIEVVIYDGDGNPIELSWDSAGSQGDDMLPPADSALEVPFPHVEDSESEESSGETGDKTIEIGLDVEIIEPPTPPALGEDDPAWSATEPIIVDAQIDEANDAEQVVGIPSVGDRVVLDDRIRNLQFGNLTHLVQNDEGSQAAPDQIERPNVEEQRDPSVIEGLLGGPGGVAPNIGAVDRDGLDVFEEPVKRIPEGPASGGIGGSLGGRTVNREISLTQGSLEAEEDQSSQSEAGEALQAEATPVEFIGSDDATGDDKPVAGPSGVHLDESIAAEVTPRIGSRIDPARLGSLDERVVTDLTGSVDVDQDAFNELVGGDQVITGRASMLSDLEFAPWTIVSQTVTDNGTVITESRNEGGDGVTKISTEYPEGSLVVRQEAFQYDNGYMTVITTYPDGSTSTQTASPDGRIVTVGGDTRIVSEAGMKWVYKDGELVSLTFADGTTVTFERNEDGNLTSTTTPAGSSGSQEGSEASQGSQQTQQGDQSGDSDNGSDSDDDQDDDDDASESQDTTDAAADTDQSSKEEDEQGDAGKSGTPNPLNEDSDGPPLFFVTGGRMGRDEMNRTERGIDVASGGGHTDPVEDAGEGDSLAFLTSKAGRQQRESDEDAIEGAVSGGHTDPTGEGYPGRYIPNTTDLRNLELIAQGGGVVDPPDTGGESGGSGGPIIGGGTLDSDDGPGEGDGEGAAFDPGQYLMPGDLPRFSESHFMPIQSIDLNLNLDEDEIEGRIEDIIDE